MHCRRGSTETIMTQELNAKNSKISPCTYAKFVRMTNIGPARDPSCTGTAALDIQATIVPLLASA